MWLTPSIFLFLTRILLRIFMVFSSCSIFISWVGLELNTLAFIPLLLTSKTKFSRECSIKYFLTQTLASLLFLAGGFLSIRVLNLIRGEILILAGLAIKLGAAPFHRWLISVAESCQWDVLFVLLTVQKINPLIILWGKISVVDLFASIILASVIVGGFLGLAHTNSRLILVFSSISHVGWLIAGLIGDLQLILIYFIIYLVILWPLINVLKKFNVSSVSQLRTLNLNFNTQFILFILLLSLGGLPPFLGFLPKLIILQFLISGKLFFLSAVFIVMSLFTLYFYLRLSFSSMLMSSGKLNLLKNSKLNNFLILFYFSISLFGLPLTFLL